MREKVYKQKTPRAENQNETRYRSNRQRKIKHFKNLSDHKMTRDQNNLLSKGLNYIPTQVAIESHVRKELLKDFYAFARRIRLKYIFRGQEKEPHPFHVKSNWKPPFKPLIALETYLEVVNI